MSGFTRLLKGIVRNAVPSHGMLGTKHKALLQLLAVLVVAGCTVSLFSTGQSKPKRLGARSLETDHSVYPLPVEPVRPNGGSQPNNPSSDDTFQTTIARPYKTNESGTENIIFHDVETNGLLQIKVLYVLVGG